MVRPDDRRFGVLAVALVLLVLPLGGCVGGGSGSGAEDARYASFSAAASAPGPEVAPEGGGPERLKVLKPVSTAGVATGTQEVVVLLTDGEGPITDAEMTLDARMPAMGHGADPEEDPVHDGHGVYVGSTNLVMSGQWNLLFNATLADGSTRSFVHEITVGDERTTDLDNGSRPEPLRYTTFDQAFGAPGVTYEPLEEIVETTTGGDSGISTTDYANEFSFAVDSIHAAEIDVGISYDPGTVGRLDELTFTLRDPNGAEAASTTMGGAPDQINMTLGEPAAGGYVLNVSGRAVDASYSVEIHVRYTLTLTLLDPPDPSKAQVGRQPFVVLLYEDAIPAPETNATVTLSSTMPAMGHGTDGEEDPEPTGAGTYTGWTNHSMPGRWLVNVTATLPSDRSFDYSLEFTVAES